MTTNTDAQPAKEAAAPKPPAEAAKTDAPDILTAATPRQDDQNVAASNEAPASPAIQTQNTEAPPAGIGQPPIPTARPNATAGLGGTSKTNDSRARQMARNATRR
ncbi:hypothetical protein AJ88_18770 [Mesorhizobium amorphae CCBAU 01583]|nr:hypothetical protein AJ88_18770 [Mesorhizobium amorphae CCBAU 01583]